jgi:cobalt-zinc-cadmium efflux system outer membrane protein
MYFRKLLFLGVLLISVTGFIEFGFAETSTLLNIDQALQRALLNNPNLESFDSRSQVAEGLKEQAGLKPNPNFTTEIEDFLGSGPFNGADSLEITVGLNQLIERGGKRSLRTQFAQSQMDLIKWDKAVYLTELRYTVRRVFVNVLISQQFVELNRELLQLAQDSLDAVNRLVKSASVTKVEASRADLALKQREFELQRAESSLYKAKSELAVLWGLSAPPDFQATGELTLKTSPPPLERLIPLLEQTPDLARFEAKIRTYESALEIERSQSIQDVSVFAGIRGFNESDDAAFLAGFEIPLPIHDRNQGNIRAALAQVRQANAEKEILRRDLMAAMVSGYQNLIQAYEEARILKSQLLPHAETTQIETEIGYQRGLFTLVAVLESRGNLFQIRNQYLEALKRYQQAQATIERLTLPATVDHEY